MKRFSVVKTIILTALVIPLAYAAFAQCKGLAKKRVSELAPYIFSGQINTVNLEEGQTANMTGALLGGQEYKIMVVGSEKFSPFTFRILDKDKKVLFDNKDHSNAQSWVFKVGTTENYTIEVGVPAPKKAKPVGAGIPTACVAIMVGFKAASN